MGRHKSLQVLERRIREMQAQVAKLKQADKPGMREVLALLRKHGLSLADVKAALEAAKPAAGRSKPKGRRVKAKYRNPDDSSQLWAGRGRMPSWLAERVKNGEKRENFLIGLSKPNGQHSRANGQAEEIQCAARLHEMQGMALDVSPGVSTHNEEAGHA